MASHMDPNSPTKLTEFAPLSSEVKQSGGFLSWLFKKPPNDNPQTQQARSMKHATDLSSRSPSEVVQSPPLEHHLISAADGEDKDVSEVGSSASEAPSGEASGSPGLGATQPRNLSSVLKRLSNILDSRSQTPQAYKDSDFKQYWMPDSNCKQCYECGDKFHTFRRRHHCRICGQIFCSRCCNQEVPGKIMGYTGCLRVCTYCCKVVLSYAQNPDASGDVRSLSEDLERQLSSVDSDPALASGAAGQERWTPTASRHSIRSSKSYFDDESLSWQRAADAMSPPPKMNPFDVTPQSEYSNMSFQEERKILLQDSSQLRDLWSLMRHPIDGVELQSHRHRLRTYPNCFVGSELVDWLIMRDRATSREQAIVLGQALVDAQWLECVTSNEQIFRDEHALYKPGKAALSDSPRDVSPPRDFPEEDDESEPLWFKEIKQEDEDNISFSELSNIPAGVSAPEKADPGSSSVFYISRPENAEPARRPKKLKTSVSTSSSGSSLEKDPVQFYLPETKSPKHVTGIRVRERCLSGSEAMKALEDVGPEGETEVFLGGKDAVDGLVFSSVSADAEIPALKENTDVTTVQQNWHEDSASQEDVCSFSLGALAANSDGATVEMESPQLGSWQQTADLREENGERLAFERLSKAQREHVTALTKQLLGREGLSQKWSDTILGIVWKISSVVRPDVRHEGDDMDIRKYIQIKKIPGGSRSHTHIVSGVVCTKNLAHKKMRQHIVNPKILLLRAPIEYQRVENKFSSLEPQILQEHEFLKNCVARISSLQPDILLVEKTVSRVAQEFLYDAGITLVLNVKPSVMAKVSRFTQADINTSLDSLVSKTTMGFCHNFKLQSYTLPDGSIKTLMFFDGCASHLGCTVTLRGGSLQELKKLKQIILFMSFVAYHLRLEMSFLMDEFAMPPPGPDESTLDLALSDGSSNTVTPTAANGADDLFHSRSKGPTDKKAVFSDDDISMFSKSKDGQSETAEEKEKEDAVDKKDVRVSVPKMEITESGNDKLTEVSEPAHNSKDYLKPIENQTSNSQSSSQENLVETRSLTRESSTVEVEDFSDPLHSYQISKDETIFQNQEVFEEHSSTRKRFKKALNDVILNSSPYTRYDIPYLETDVGSKCKLRSYFEKELYFSIYFSEGAEKRKCKLFDAEESQNQKKQPKVRIVSPHPFVLEKLTKPLRDQDTQTLLADFRARGGTIQPIIPREDSCFADTEVKTENPKQGQSDGAGNKPVDCLDPHHHQRIAVLFGSYAEESANAPYPCVQPWVVSMDFYGRNDITLGGFLERYCFRENYKCPNETCDTPMVDHIRRFVHELGCLQVVLKRLDTPIPAYQNNILMWGWCKKCRQVTPVVPMSLDTWSMSFAKYLELRFHGGWYGRRASADPCPHSLHHDHLQYFGYKQTVVSFKYYSVGVREIALPPMLITLKDPECPPFRVMEETKMLHFQGTSAYSSILEHLHKLKRDVQTDNQAAQLATYISKLQIDKEKFRGLMDQLQIVLPRLHMTQQYAKDIEDKDVMCQGDPDVIFGIQDLLVDIKRQIAESIMIWNGRIHDMDLQQKKMERSRILSGNANRSSRDNLGSPDNVDGAVKSHAENEASYQVGSAGSGSEERTSAVGSTDVVNTESIGSCGEIGSVDPSHFGTSCSVAASAASAASSSAGFYLPNPDVTLHPGEESVQSSSSSRASGHSEDDVDGTSSGQGGEGQKGHQRSRSSGDTKKMIKHGPPSKESYVTPDPEKLERRATMKNLFNTFLSSSDVNPIQMPFNADEHHTLPPCEKIPIVVCDQEPSSIIAYALSSADYARELQQLRASPAKDCQGSPKLRPGQKAPDTLLPGGTSDPLSGGSMETGKKGSSASSVLSFFRGQVRERSPNRLANMSKYDVDTVKYNPKVDRDSMEEADDFSLFGQTTTDADKNKAAKQVAPNYHIELQFSDPSAKFYCRVYYAEQFAKLRKLIFPSGEERYIRSLSRCFTWLARGGKSGSMFCKTQDDRFILKQMSKYEVQSFVDFAPLYLQYVTKAYHEKKPTALAKILGVYRIGYRNNQTNTALKQDLLVMENLFYERQITQIFDLKGSMRNRLVSVSEKRVEDLVLLDENLLKASTESPLYIRPHSKTVLTRAITNDSQFLSSNLVMDYSLLVGLDEDKRELVVGIIDYIRTFTWDKKLEMLVKSGLSGQGRMPTVVSPELYRGRYLEAMDRYFLMVPDRWTGLGINMDS